MSKFVHVFNRYRAYVGTFHFSFFRFVKTARSFLITSPTPVLESVTQTRIFSSRAYTHTSVEHEQKHNFLFNKTAHITLDSFGNPNLVCQLHFITVFQVVLPFVSSLALHQQKFSTLKYLSEKYRSVGRNCLVVGEIYFGREIRVVERLCSPKR